MVWNITLELAAGDYYIELTDQGGDGWTCKEDALVRNTPWLIMYSKDCRKYVGSYTFGEAPVFCYREVRYCCSDVLATAAQQLQNAGMQASPASPPQLLAGAT
jgi:hypothetical protein